MSFRDACARALRALSSRLARRRAVADWYLPNSSEEERTAVFASGMLNPAGSSPRRGVMDSRAGVPAQMSRKRSSSPSLGKNMLTFHFRSSHSRIWRSASSRRISCITKSPASKLPRGLSWMAREKSSSPAAFSGGEVRMHTFPRSLQKGAVITRSPGLIQSRRVSVPSASVSMRLTCSALRKEIWESTSNSRMDSISSSKNSRRTGWEDWRGKTSRMPPRRDHCPREMTCGTPSNPASPNCRIKSSGACVSPVFRVIPWFCMPSGDGTSSFRLPSVKMMVCPPVRLEEMR